MFEKEAEDYSIDTYETCLYDNLPYMNDSRAREESFKDGAEFGYNKANEWHAELEKENRVLKCFIKDLIYENYNMCFQFSNTTCLFNSDYRNRAEELIGEKLSL